MSKSAIRILVWAVLALATSCQREAETPVPTPASKTQTIHYKTAVQTGVDTRAILGNDMAYRFEEGDRVYMESEDGKMYGFLSMSGNDGVGDNIAMFEGDLTCVGGYSPSYDTPVKLVLVSPDDDLHTTTDGKVDEVNGASYQNKWASSLEESVRRLSHFTGSGIFGATQFTLNQQSSFLKCNIRIKSAEAPVNSTVTVSLYNQSNIPLTSASITVQTAGSVPFVFALQGGETSLSDAVLRVEWGDSENAKSKNFSIKDKDLETNSFYTIFRDTREYRGFHIRAKNDGTDMTFKYTDVEFSEDFGDNWTTYDGRTFHLNANDVVCFRGTRADCNCSGNTQLFTATDVCYIAGEIASLLGYPETLPASAFRGAFSRKNTKDTGNNTGKDDEKPAAITVDTSKPADYVDWVDIDPADPLILPATTAADCYMDMVLGCISLTCAPDLPATVLADKCYFRMFHSCIKLTSMPSFPSVVTMSGSSTRRRYCYQMFQSSGVKELTEPLPVGQNSTLARGCFEDMFAHCTSLTKVIPGLLPATTLAADCYRGMFQNTRFDTAPDLLATELVSECYRFMFSSCTKLKNIKCLATTHLGSGYTTNWVGNNGTVNIPNTTDCVFIRAATKPKWPNNAHGIPSNWKIEENAE